MYCLDTNIIVDIFRGDEGLRGKVSKVVDSGAEIFISSISLCELFKGAFAHSKKDEKINQIRSFISNCNLIDLNIDSCEEFGKSYYNLDRMGKKVPEFDLMIASIVKANGLILVTRDKKHFENLGIKIEVW